MEKNRVLAVLQDEFNLSAERAQQQLERAELITTEYCFVIFRGETIDQLYVGPEARGQGIGLQLMQKAIKRGGRRLNCQPSLRKYYEKLGFTEYLTMDEYCYMAIDPKDEDLPLPLRPKR